MARAPKRLWALDRKVVLVLGGEGLIGKAICCGLCELGAQVVDADVSFDGFREAKGKGQARIRCHVEINSDASLEALLDQIEKRGMTVDVLVNAAYPRGKGYGKAFWNVQSDDLCEDLALHAGGCFRASQAVARRMVERKVEGSIVHFGSIYGVVAPSFRIYRGTSMGCPPNYALIKGGIIQFTKYLAAYLAPYGIRVNCISPGGVQDGQPAKFIRRYNEQTPLGRMAVPEDLVGPVAFLASDASRYVTGHNLLVDGGWSIT